MPSSGDNLYTRVHGMALRQLEGSLTPEEHRELESLLLGSQAACRAYIEYFQDTACLRWLCLEEPLSDGDEQKSLRPDSPSGYARRLSRSFVFYGGLACVLAMVTGGLLYDHWNGAPPADNVAANTGEHPQNPVVSTQVATVTGLGAIRWKNATQDSARLLSRCAVGDRLQLDEGAVELTFDAGAQVTVFGPADFTIMSPTSIQCRRGRVTTLVGERGKGFVVLTPKAKVVDLGTQFGLSIGDNGETEVVVFQGTVDMTPATPAAGGNIVPTRRLSQGDAMMLTSQGQFERVVSVQRNDFITPVESVRRRPSEPVIGDIHDNIRSADEGVKSYQIVRGGLEDDALCFVDRMHQWNGIDRTGLPKFLAGADYVMPFNNDKFSNTLELKLRLLRPAHLYVFLDNNMQVPDWLKKDFADTGVDIGLDGGQTEWHKEHSLAVGTGNSVDFNFSVWKRDIKKAGIVTLGPVNPPKVGTRSAGFNMYGIAAVAAE